MTIGYTGQNKNPIENIRFYTRKKHLVSFSIKNNGLIPTCFTENICRVFGKNQDKHEVATMAFNDLIARSDLKVDE